MSRPTTLSAWLDFIQAQHPSTIELGLDRVRAVAERLGLERSARQVVTVGGTNGKGSTVAFIEAIARAGGWKVGAYTSPHLLRYNERVRIDGVEADDAALMAGFEAVDAARGEIPLTYFEYGTLAALWLFQRAGLDLVILEVGLGGRLDAVNLVDPDVAVITTVDIDHTDWLGPDRESIGKEKVGIARAWKPLVLGEVTAPSSVLAHAYAIGAGVIQLGNDFFHEPVEDGAGQWRWREVGTELLLPAPLLDAPAQRANAATAVAAVRALPDELPSSVFAAGIARAQLPGRLQRFERGGVEIRVDVAHNPQAARELAAFLDRQPMPTHAVFAALADKDVAGVADALAGKITHWSLAGLEPGTPRGQTAAALAGALADTEAAQGSQFETVAQALDAALAQAKPGERVLVFGSFHTVAEALAILDSAR
ncbi:bifunctional tetrahydrofolate synthase/dihydrofolate synthase [Pseudoxanthomonas sp. GM95]|uniref:bifunctional tetrahydrofolate synthase/dihydrofolate synthase n=1 Tax=Pseudoxanthomonas sp. GM95 TaxID=1881043 RepID=UPI000B88C3A9|nr:bifunctional tetrahydrofolate synthase/dihydrofolate synthase [Pseudoxanthomonas sp. GM95]